MKRFIMKKIKLALALKIRHMILDPNVSIVFLHPSSTKKQRNVILVQMKKCTTSSSTDVKNVQMQLQSKRMINVLPVLKILSSTHLLKFVSNVLRIMCTMLRKKYVFQNLKKLHHQHKLFV